MNINIIVSIGNIHCDECLKSINQGDKYVVDAQQKSVFMTDSATFRPDEKRFKRYCMKCAVKHGYLKLIEDNATKERFYARGRLGEGEKQLSITLGEWKHPEIDCFPDFGRFCRACGKPTSANIDAKGVATIVCNNLDCSLYSHNQETIKMELEKTLNKLPVLEHFGHHCAECGLPMDSFKKYTDKDIYMYVVKCSNWQCGKFAVPQGVIKQTQKDGDDL
jgi:hypothetical protein